MNQVCSTVDLTKNHIIDHHEIIHTLKRKNEFNLFQISLKWNERPQWHVLTWWIKKNGYYILSNIHNTLRWRHNGHDGVANHQPHDCLLNRLFRHRSKKTSKLRVTGLCVGNSPGTGEFPAQMASYAENVSIWWRHHERFAYDYF